VQPEEPDMVDLPIVCTLLPGELNAKAMALLPGIVRTATQRVEIENGYRFEFLPTGATLTAITAMIEVERRCCRFLQFRLTVEPGEGPFRLDVSGPVGTQAFLAALFDAQ
jgi:hypothetical protein